MDKNNHTFSQIYKFLLQFIVSIKFCTQINKNVFICMFLYAHQIRWNILHICLIEFFKLYKIIFFLKNFVCVRE